MFRESLGLVLILHDIYAYLIRTFFVTVVNVYVSSDCYLFQSICVVCFIMYKCVV